VVVSFAFLGLLLLAVAMASALGVGEVKQRLQEQRLFKMATEHPLWSNVARGLALCVCGPLFVALLPFALLKRSIRRWRSTAGVGGGGEGDGDREEGGGGGGGERGGRVFKEVVALQLIEDAKQWPWTTVLRFSWWWGLAYFALQALVKTLITLFMAWSPSFILNPKT